jgi:hypothetical protein
MRYNIQYRIAMIIETSQIAKCIGDATFVRCNGPTPPSQPSNQEDHSASSSSRMTMDDPFYSAMRELQNSQMRRLFLASRVEFALHPFPLRRPIQRPSTTTYKVVIGEETLGNWRVSFFDASSSISCGGENDRRGRFEHSRPLIVREAGAYVAYAYRWAPAIHDNHGGTHSKLRPHLQDIPVACDYFLQRAHPQDIRGDIRGIVFHNHNGSTNGGCGIQMKYDI